jgi:cell division protein FtsB
VATRRSPLRIRWERVGRVVLLVVLGVVLGLYVQQGLSYLSVRQQADGQAAIVHQLERANARLVREQTALNNSATIQQDARALGMVRPGERPYVITGLPSH